VITHTGQYAVWAVVCIAETGTNGRATVAQVARASGVPANYLAKILHALARVGVLASSRGRHGGFRLTRPPDRLTLAEVLAPFEEAAPAGCMLARGHCPHDDHCRSWRRCTALSREVARFLQRTRIADLMEVQHAPAPGGVECQRRAP